MQRLLLLDDEASILSALQRTLRPHFGRLLKVDACGSAAEALALGAAHRYDLVISDLRMPVMDGLEFLTRFAVLQPESVRLMLTGSADFATAQRAVNEIGIYRYLTKPWTADEIVGHLHDALAHAGQRRRERDGATAWESSCGLMSPQEAERRKLEAIEPGLTRVEWEADGSVLMPPLDHV